MDDPMPERWLSVEEAAAYLGIKRDTAYKWIDRKAMPAHKVGRLWKFRREEIDAWVRSGRAANSSGASGPGGLPDTGRAS
jgi:excisionase family DNA binding protein